MTADDMKWMCFAACWHMIGWTQALGGRPAGAWWGWGFAGPWSWYDDRGFLASGDQLTKFRNSPPWAVSATEMP